MFCLLYRSEHPNWSGLLKEQEKSDLILGFIVIFLLFYKNKPIKRHKK
jgi:hypothetical protein